jgi:hypothetical protein
VLTRHEDWFTTWTLIAPYVHEGWSAGRGTFAGFFFDDDEAYLVAGAFAAPTMTDFAVAFSESVDVNPDGLKNPSLGGGDASALDRASIGKKNEFRYAAHVWRDSKPKENVEWTVGCLEAAIALWDQEVP